MNKPHLILTPGDLCVGPQEIVLVNRHRIPPRSSSEFDERVNEYEATRIGPREIRFESDIETEHLLATLDVRRYFILNGSLCRMFRISPEESRRRRRGRALAREIMPCQVVAWLLSQRSGSRPTKINLLYHVSRPGEVEPIDFWAIEIPVAPSDMIEGFIELRLELIAEAMAMDDGDLPACSLEERHGSKADSFAKCRYCRAARVCTQFQRHVETM